MDDFDHTSDELFERDTAIVDKIVNWGVCSIAGIALLIVGYFAIAPDLGGSSPSSAQETPAALSGPGPEALQNPLPGTTTASPEPSADQTAAAAGPNDPSARRERRRASKPEEVEVPVVIEVREHRGDPKSTPSRDDDGR